MILLCVLLGFLIALLGLPILESIVSIIQTVTELFRAKCGVKIMQYKVKIEELSEPKDEHTKVIGFAINDIDEEDNYVEN